VLESHEVNEPTTPGMKYHHFATGVPIMLRTLLQRCRRSVVIGSMQRVGLDAFLGEVERGTSSRLGLMAQDNSPLLARARCEGSQSVTFSLGGSAGPTRAVQRLFEGLLRRRCLPQVGHEVGQVETNRDTRDAQWWSQE
jgi:Putative GTP-binding controlling metal-binding